MIFRRIYRSRRARIVAAASAGLLMLTLLTLPHWLPTVLAARQTDLLFRVPSAGRQIYLTIDDGPSPATEQILTVLAKHQVHATFFIIGGHVHDPAQLTAICAGGHALAHHMKTTQACSILTPEGFRADFDEVDQLLLANGGVRLFRPPSDFGTREQLDYVASKEYRAVVGTVYPLDHWLEDPGTIRWLTAWLAIDGGIIILHDGAVRGPRTAEVLDALIPELKRRGFAFGNLATELGLAKEAK